MGWGTCVYVAGHLLCLDIKGNLFLMRPDPDRFVKVAEMRGVLGDVRGAAWTIPVVANGRIYLPTIDAIYCIGDPEAEIYEAAPYELPQEVPIAPAASADAPGPARAP